MPPNVTLEARRVRAAADLTATVTEIEQYLTSEGADPESEDYVALRERRDEQQHTLSEVLASIAARNLAQHVPARPTVNNTALSEMGQILREYDGRGNSPRFNISLDLRELQTGDPTFTSPPSRITVAALPVLTPSLDVVSQVQTLNQYDFTVPPPPVVATAVAEGGKKRTEDWVSTKVSGTLETDALIIDVTRQTLEDDTSAESTLRSWLVQGVRLAQDAKVSAAIAGATGTLTATGADLLTAIRNGKAELSEIGVAATAVYLNPADAAAIDIAAMGQAHIGPVGQSALFGMRIVESPGITVGAPIVGSMAQAVYLLFRSTISTYLTDSGTTDEVTPRDRFSHNIIGILAEGRSRAHVVQPKLLCKCTVGAGAAAASQKPAVKKS